MSALDRGCFVILLILVILGSVHSVFLKIKVRSSKFGPLTSLHSGFTKNKVRSPNNESNPGSVHLK